MRNPADSDMSRKSLALALALMLGLASSAEAQNMVERRTASIVATGLFPEFPPGFACTPIASPYGSPTRFDGSVRRNDRNSGLHGGMDLTLQDGTPLLAVASGEVIAKGEGGRLEGIFLWLRISPEDSGLPFWTFAKYQHLSALPALATGTRVVAGQAIALSGNTGTVGGHYGAAGYPHLHLSTHFGPSPDFNLVGMYASMVKAEGAELGDPLILYLPGIAQTASLTGEKQRVAVPIVDVDGRIVPAGSKTVWPVACLKK